MAVLRKFIAVAALLSVLSAVAVVLAYRELHSPLAMAESERVITLEQGGNLHTLSETLGEAGVLEHPWLLRLYARLSGRESVRAGEYRIESGDTPLALLEKVRRGEVVIYSATLVEGWTFRDALDYLARQEKLAHHLDTEAALTSFLSELDLPDDHPEGWFFPDTYRYVAGDSDRDLLRRAHRRMRDVLDTQWTDRAGALPYDSPYEALTMASIVERETGVPNERNQIAGVFVRRLEQGMRLQTDPTVIYGLADDYDGNIQRRHLSQETAYNTYRIDGLPPTPIALPGREAINAALHPADGETLYFVARGDGSHHFSATLEEHNRAVRRYQLQQRSENYRSAPATDAENAAEQSP